MNNWSNSRLITTFHRPDWWKPFLKPEHLIRYCGLNWDNNRIIIIYANLKHLTVVVVFCLCQTRAKSYTKLEHHRHHYTHLPLERFQKHDSITFRIYISPFMVAATFYYYRFLSKGIGRRHTTQKKETITKYLQSVYKFRLISCIAPTSHGDHTSSDKRATFY